MTRKNHPLDYETPEELWRRADALENAGFLDAAKAMRKKGNENWDYQHGYFDDMHYEAEQ